MRQAFDGAKFIKRLDDFGWADQVFALRWFAKYKFPITIQTINNWKNNGCPTPNNRKRIARLLRVTEDYFLPSQRKVANG